VSYLTFHFVFILPAIVLMMLTLPRPIGGVAGARGIWSLPLVALIAFVYTTPWDNYLVYREVWWYGPDRVIATIGYVPLEEYMFFMLQPFLTGLFLYHLLGRWQKPELNPGPADGRVRLIGALIYGLITAIGVGLLLSGMESGLYMGLILAWATPVLLLMWIYAGDVIWQMRRFFLMGVAVPTVYLWIADWYAIRDGIWDISATLSFNVRPFGLPVEEAIFFLITNLLVVQGVMLFLFGKEIGARRFGRAKTTATTI
jgi:lycopene beta-cyclase